MTRSRYIAELLATTEIGHYEAACLASELASIDGNESKRRKHFRRSFNSFSADIARRFYQTIAMHKALVCITDSLPHSDHRFVVSIRATAHELHRGL